MNILTENEIWACLKEAKTSRKIDYYRAVAEAQYAKCQKQDTELREKIVKHLSDNIALFDCQGDCPDEVALNMDLRTSEYCNNCFADQILALIGDVRKQE